MSPEEKALVKERVDEALDADDEKALRAREALASEIRAGIDKEFLKKEILDDLNPKESAWWKRLGHPAFLLVAGFALTTVGGTIFGSCWQSRQSRLEQKRLTDQAVIKQKYDIKDDVIKGIAETNTAAEDVLASYGWGPNDGRRKKDASERWQKWQDASRNWRTKSKILAENLAFRFADPAILAIFKQITTKRSEVGLRIADLQGRIEDSKGRVLSDQTLGYSLLENDDFTDLRSLVAKLRTGNDPVSRYLTDRLSVAAKVALEHYDGSDSSSNEVRNLLTQELNRLIMSGRPIYELGRLKQVDMKDELKQLISRKKRGSKVIGQFNRLLLARAYHDEIKYRDFGSEVSDANKLLGEMIQLSGKLMQAMKSEIQGDEIKNSG